MVKKTRLRASVIIPTFNRLATLIQTIDSLASQTMPKNEFEVLVIDDGSTTDLCSVTEGEWPFRLELIYQVNQGSTAARNNGASQSLGETLVFIDDDIRLLPDTLQRLVYEAEQHDGTIVLGTLVIPELIIESSIFARLTTQDSHEPTGIVPFTSCLTGLLAIRRDKFYEIGGFQDPTGGWPNWDDVDFGYRASQKGVQLLRLLDASAEHWDYAATDFKVACGRWQRASHSAVRLLQQYPQLFEHLPMFHDKVPVNWSADSVWLISRKLLRRITSTCPAVYSIENVVRQLEQHYPRPSILQPLYRWIIGSYIFNGYRRGLKELEPRV